MTDQERIKRLEFLLESAEKMIDIHLQARLRAEEAVAGLHREKTHEELQWRVQQLETQLDLCYQATLKGIEADIRFRDLRPEDYIYSPALIGILRLFECQSQAPFKALLDEARASENQLDTEPDVKTQPQFPLPACLRAPEEEWFKSPPEMAQAFEQLSETEALKQALDKKIHDYRDEPDDHEKPFRIPTCS